MFSGLVEEVGRITSITEREGAKRFEIRCELARQPTPEGASICVDGVCLSVVGTGLDTLRFDVVAETLERSTLGRAEPGRRVNLESALRVGDRLGGHMVQGHVDCTAPVLEVRRLGHDYRLRVGFDPVIERYVASKGSLTLNGVSLTVAALDEHGFEVVLVPHTLARTNLGTIQAGDRVNVEADLLARYLDRLIDLPGGPKDDDER